MRDSDQYAIGDIFDEGPLVIPNYQRGYSWKPSHVFDLLEDIEYLIQETQEGSSGESPYHYFGTIILHNDGTNLRIVDGQQRIVTVTLIVASLLDSACEISNSTENQYVDRYIGDENTPRLRIHDRDMPVFRRLMYRQIDPEALRGETISQQNLIEAKRIVDNWASERAMEGTALAALNQIDQGLETTTHQIDTASEAGRIFETINDRGRDLSLADKIKSYLIFASDRLDEDGLELGQQIFDIFGEVERRIAMVDGDETSLDNFFKEHWRMFTGEALYDRSDQYEINDIHRRIKKESQHAPLTRPDEAVVKWIRSYLESIDEASIAYQVVTNPKSTNRKGTLSADSEIAQELYKLDVASGLTQDTRLALLMAAYLRFGTQVELRTIVDLLETFSFRAYEVALATRNTRRTRFRKVSFRLYYAGRKTQAEKIFGSDVEVDLGKIYVSLTDGLERTCREIENGIGNYASNQEFQRNLQREDLLQGSRNDDGWNGMRKQSILYFLYYYSQSLEETAFTSYPLDHIVEDKFELIHLWPRDSDKIEPDRLLEHQRNRNRLGNFAYVTKNLNPGTDWDDLTYEMKYERLVDNPSSPALLRRLVDYGRSEWGEEQILERLSRMVEFALDHWDVPTGAYVRAKSPDGSTLNQKLTDHIRELVRNDFDEDAAWVPDELNNLPKVVVGIDARAPGSSHVEGCPKCGNTEMIVTEDGNQPKLECVCGESLIKPSTTYHFEKYS